MREYVLDAIVLHAQDYKDNNKILTLLSSEGKISATCKGINKQASKLKMVACPFCFAEFSLIEKNIITVSGANIYDTFFALSTNYTNFICASCILDLVKRCPEDNSVLGEMFLPCVNAIKELCYNTTPPIISLLKFLLTYLSITGYKINLHTCASCGNKLKTFYFNPYEANVVCFNCSNQTMLTLKPNQIAFLQDITNNQMDNNEQLSLLKSIANAIYCLTNIKLKIEELIK